MRFKMIATFAFAANLSVLAGTCAAQRPAQPPTQQQTQGQPQSASPATPGQGPMGPGMMTMGPGMAQMMGQMAVRPQTAGGRGQVPDAGGPLQMVSRLLTALDDTRVRTMLGISDQQADGLRKIILDTETFTITTGAAIAVDSLELRELLRADKPDRAAVTSKGDEISKSTSGLISHYLDAILAVKAILTPEQQEMIRAYVESGAPVPPAPPGHR
jgi:hypothetical protein